MKKLLVVTIAALSLVAMQARATVSLHIDALDLLDNSSSLAPLDTVGLFVVDTTGAGFALPTSIASGSSIAVGSFFDDTALKIISATDLTATGTPGDLGIDFGPAVYPAGVSAGEKFGIIWLPSQTLADTTLEGGYAGIFSDGSGQYSTAWVLPPDGSTSGFDMTTVSETGGVPDADGIANIIIVPEPSSLALVVVGLLGAVGMIRRRS
jgi:hypothetical protein